MFLYVLPVQYGLLLGREFLAVRSLLLLGLVAILVRNKSLFQQVIAGNLYSVGPQILLLPHVQIRWFLLR